MLFSSCTRGPLYYLKNHYSSLRATSFKSLRSSHMGACATAINNTPVLTSKYFGFNLPQISPFSSNSSGNLRDQGSSTSTSGGSGSGLIKKEWKLRTDPDDVNATALDAEAINGTLLFDGKQDLTIKLQFCAGSVNALVWGTNLIDMTINKGQFAEVTMFPMLADPMWETLGLMGTGLIFFLSSVFTRLTIRRAYLSSDGKRLGFETYTMLGGGGRKIEAPLGNVSMEPLGNKPNASWLRIAIIGLEKPLLMAADGIFHNRPELIRLLNTKVSNVVPKEERVIQRNLSRRRKS